MIGSEVQIVYRTTWAMCQLSNDTRRPSASEYSTDRTVLSSRTSGGLILVLEPPEVYASLAEEPPEVSSDRISYHIESGTWVVVVGTLLGRAAKGADMVLVAQPKVRTFGSATWIGSWLSLLPLRTTSVYCSGNTTGARR